MPSKSPRAQQRGESHAGSRTGTGLSPKRCWPSSLVGSGHEGALPETNEADPRVTTQPLGGVCDADPFCEESGPGACCTGATLVQQGDVLAREPCTKDQEDDLELEARLNQLSEPSVGDLAHIKQLVSSRVGIAHDPAGPRVALDRH